MTPIVLERNIPTAPFLAYYGKYDKLSKGGVLAFPYKRNNDLSLLFREAWGEWEATPGDFN